MNQLLVCLFINSSKLSFAAYFILYYIILCVASTVINGMNGLKLSFALQDLQNSHVPNNNYKKMSIIKKHQKEMFCYNIVFIYWVGKGKLISLFVVGIESVYYCSQYCWRT